jgi:hypothetical protein
MFSSKSDYILKELQLMATPQHLPHPQIQVLQRQEGDVVIAK